MHGQAYDNMGSAMHVKFYTITPLGQVLQKFYCSNYYSSKVVYLSLPDSSTLASYLQARLGFNKVEPPVVLGRLLALPSSIKRLTVTFALAYSSNYCCKKHYSTSPRIIIMFSDAKKESPIYDGVTSFGRKTFYRQTFGRNTQYTKDLPT
jgi:hypothetical protein